MRIDTRAGSKELFKPLRELGVVAEEATLIAGDVEIVGYGNDGPYFTGIEYKTLEDAIACMRNGRFADQLRAMKSNYDISWLLLEGRIRPDRKGVAVRRGEKWFPVPGGVTYQELVAWVMTMAQCGGVLVWRTETKQESAAWLRALEIWWSKDWDKHNAHLEWYTPPLCNNPFEGEPSLVHRVAAVLPGIGAKKSREVARHFKSVKEMCCVSQDEWVKIEGVGKKLATKVVAAIGGEDGTHPVGVAEG